MVKAVFINYMGTTVNERSHWINAPVFPNAHGFFDRCPVPTYIITNIGLIFK